MRGDLDTERIRRVAGLTGLAAIVFVVTSLANHRATALIGAELPISVTVVTAVLLWSRRGGELAAGLAVAAALRFAVELPELGLSAAVVSGAMGAVGVALAANLRRWLAVRRAASRHLSHASAADFSLVLTVLGIVWPLLEVVGVEIAQRGGGGLADFRFLSHLRLELTGALAVVSVAATWPGRLSRIDRSPARLVEAVVWTAAALLASVLGWQTTAAPTILPLALLVVLTVRVDAPIAVLGAAVMAVVMTTSIGLVIPRPLTNREEVHFVAWTLMAILLTGGVAHLLAEVRRERRRIADGERHFRDAMYNSPFGMALLSLEGRCFLVNRAICDLLGYEENELVGRHPAEFSIGVDVAAAQDRVRRLVAGEIAPYTVEKQFLHKSGRPIWVFLAVSLVRDEIDGRPLFLIAQLTDIEARRKVEFALEESESRWNFALESAGQGVWDHDYRRRETFYSPVWARMLGYRPDELPVENDAWLGLVHPDDVATVLHHEQRHLDGLTEQFECEFRMHHKDGRWLWILDRGKVIARSEDGRPLRMIGTHTDITEHRILTEALQAEKERLRITLHSIGDAVVCTDATGMVTFMNPVGEALTGWKAEHAIGRPCCGVFHLEYEGGVPAECPTTRCLATRERVSEKDAVVLVGRSGARIDVEASASPICRPTGELLGAVLVFKDVTRSRTLQKQLSQMASHDALTGLRNRTTFEQALSERCLQALREKTVHALCFIDLDRFKIINDTAGHAAGDALLREVARMIRDQMRREDVVARLGGDEFGVLLDHCDVDAAQEIAERLIDRIGRIRFSWNGRVYEIGASIGIARLDEHTPLAADLMSRADVACYAAKAGGRNRVSVYHPSEGDARRHHAEMHTAAGIRAALDTDRFEVWAQEIRDLRPAGELHRQVELLIRMRSETGELLAPGAFIPAAERFGLMSAIDRWMIDRVLHYYDRAILAAPRLSVSVNLSANSLDDPGFFEFVMQSLAASELPPHRLRFEITETSLINSMAQAGQMVKDLRAAGIAIMLDDFGTGLSSFAYLETFPIDYLKIDGAFVRKVGSNAIDRAIVESINDIGHKIGAVTIAEYVEDAEALAIVSEIGVDMAQGWHIGHPVPIDDYLAARVPGLLVARA